MCDARQVNSMETPERIAYFLSNRNHVWVLIRSACQCYSNKYPQQE